MAQREKTGAIFDDGRAGNKVISRNPAANLFSENSFFTAEDAEDKIENIFFALLRFMMLFF